MPLDELISQLELDGVRADVEQLFVDAGTIHRVTAKGTFDPDTGDVTSNTEVLVYSGEASVYPISARRDRFDEQGEGLIFIRQYRVILPFTADDIQIRDIWRTTSTEDPQLVGRPMEVRDVFVSSNVGYRRLTVHDVGE
jgi:hypothetical protein